ncbi:MAG: hypothetical protein H8E44_12480 [Planctomycetes bacterium]|nr:hypothetical protein [Planctomycetota bacterium]MBL7041769.1 hypothetical protein [Pirellulaceae bacterium]
MIPSFDEHGYLPPGIHQATLEEIEVRFGRQSEMRRVQMDSLRWLVDLVKQAGIERLIINGSFVTDAAEPNDVDCVLLTSPDFPHDQVAGRELLDGLPFLDIEMVEPRDFGILVDQVFATDRDAIPKGVVEVVL